VGGFGENTLRKRYYSRLRIGKNPPKEVFLKKIQGMGPKPYSLGEIYKKISGEGNHGGLKQWKKKG